MDETKLAPFGTRQALGQAYHRFADVVSKCGNMDTITFEFDNVFTHYCAYYDIHPDSEENFIKWVHLCAESFLKVGLLANMEHDVHIFDMDIYKVLTAADQYQVQFWHEEEYL